MISETVPQLRVSVPETPININTNTGKHWSPDFFQQLDDFRIDFHQGLGQKPNSQIFQTLSEFFNYNWEHQQLRMDIFKHFEDFSTTEMELLFVKIKRKTMLRC